jgi:HSP20 family protein
MKLVNFNRPTTFPTFLNEIFADDFFAKRPGCENKVATPKTWQNALPAVNIKDQDGRYFIEVAAPGFEKANFSIELDKNILTISAKKSETKEEANKGYTYKEFSNSEFKRSFTLPLETVDTQKIEASYEAGVLVVAVPKKEEEIKKVSINVQ